MANLSQLDKTKLEVLLKMDSGYVLDFTDSSFRALFQPHSIDIEDSKYSQEKRSGSKANRLRGFWEQEGDEVVGKVLAELIETEEYKLSQATFGQGVTPHAQSLIADCKAIANRLKGADEPEKGFGDAQDFLNTVFANINFDTLPIQDNVKMILSARFKEAETCLQNNAPLASIFLAGSILEGILLGLACQYPEQFNTASSYLKSEDDKPKPFKSWTLAQFIDVSYEIGVLGEDVKKFSHALRDFRNYIHPYKQMKSKFNPDHDTAQICLQVVKAAMNDVSEFTKA